MIGGAISDRAGGSGGLLRVAQRAVDSQLQEVIEQLFHDVELVDKEIVVGIVDEFDPSFGQLSSEAGGHRRPAVERFVPADDRQNWNLGR